MSRLPRVIIALARGWLLVGIILLVFASAEVATTAMYAVRDALGSRNPDINLRFSAEVFAGPPWTRTYKRDLDELERSWVTWEPYVYWRSVPFAGQLIHIDADGTRRTWNAPDCRANHGAIRVFMFGGSTLWGAGARDDFTIPSWVSRKLAERGNRVCVVNWAGVNYVTTQELLRLLLQLRSGNVPDIAIFFDGANDVFAAYQSRVAGIPIDELNRRTEFTLKTRGGEMIGRGVLRELQKSSLFRLWHTIETVVGRGEIAPPQRTEAEEAALADQIVSVYAANAEIVRALGHAYRFRTLFYWQPVAFLSKPLTADEQLGLQSRRFVEGLIRQASARLDRDERLHGAGDFRDLSGIFRHTEQAIYIDFAHISERGNEMVAAEVVKDLSRLLGPEAGGAAGDGRVRPRSRLSPTRTR